MRGLLEDTVTSNERLIPTSWWHLLFENAVRKLFLIRTLYVFFSIHLSYLLQELNRENKNSDACSLHVLNPKTSKVVQLDQFCRSERSVLKCVNFESMCKSSPKCYLRRDLLMSASSLSVFYFSYLLCISFFDFAGAPFGKMWLPRL